MELLELKATWVLQEVMVYRERTENLDPLAQWDKKERKGSEVNWDPKV